MKKPPYPKTVCWNPSNISLAVETCIMLAGLPLQICAAAFARHRSALRTSMLCLIALALAASAAMADVPDYIFQFLTVPAYKATWGSGINNDQEVVFMAAAPLDATNVYQRTFLRDSSGVVTEIRYPERRTTIALGINNLGTIVGDVADPEARSYIGFLRTTNDEFSDFICTNAVGTFGGSQVNDVNDYEIIVGGYSVYVDGTNNEGGAFIRLPSGEFQSFRYLEDPNTIAFGINNLGQISGQSSSGSFLRDSDGTFLPIAFPGADETHAFNINNLGQIVGDYFDGAAHGFVRDRDGTYRTVDVPGASATGLWGINDFGELSGSANVLGITKAFVALVRVPTPPTIIDPPKAQSIEEGGTVTFSVGANGYPEQLIYQWVFNGTNLIGNATTNDFLQFTDVQLSNAGAYSVLITNVLGAVTSAPAMLQVIPVVERRPVPAINITGDVGRVLNLDFAWALTPEPDWSLLDTVNLTGPSQFYFDLTQPLPPQRFYRVWQTGAPVAIPSLDLHIVPAITLTGNIGDSLRLDYINQFGPTDAWVTLDTVTLTNASQLYFDTSVIGQPPRLWRIVPAP